jgi:VanZ family protein
MVMTSLLTLGVLTLMPGDERPHPFGTRTQLEHVFAYFVVATTVALVYAPRLKPIHILAGLAAYGAALEFGQLFVPSRTARLIDVAADIVGIISGLGVAYLIGKWLPRLRSKLSLSVG